MAPGPLKKREKRVFVTFSLFGFLAFSGSRPLRAEKFIKNHDPSFFHGHKKNARVPPLAPGARGGDPPFRAQPGIKSTPKIAIAAEKKRE